MVRRRLNVEGEIVTVEVDRVINVGFSGRDRESVHAHIDELLEEDVLAEAPDEVPTTYQVAPYTLLADPGRITVVGEETSAEAEYGLIVTGGETYVVVASDHTDRELEKRGVQKSKQITPNVVSADAWRLSDVHDHWDEIEIRAHNTVDGERELYQDATLAEILPPGEILDEIAERYPGPTAGTAVLSGTVATVGDGLAPGERFEIELRDPVRDRTLGATYDVDPL